MEIIGRQQKVIYKVNLLSIQYNRAALEDFYSYIYTIISSYSR